MGAWKMPEATRWETNLVLAFFTVVASSPNLSTYDFGGKGTKKRRIAQHARPSFFKGDAVCTLMHRHCAPLYQFPRHLFGNTAFSPYLCTHNDPCRNSPPYKPQAKAVSDNSFTTVSCRTASPEQPDTERRDTNRKVRGSITTNSNP